MNKMYLISSIFGSILFLAGSFNQATAHGPAAVTFSDITVPEAPPTAAVMAAYMQIKNNTSEDKTINQVNSPQFKRVEIHKMNMANGMMNMKKLDRLTIKAQQAIVLESGGIHVMLIKPLRPLKHNDPVTLTFKFASGESTMINTRVQRTH